MGIIFNKKVRTSLMAMLLVLGVVLLAACGEAETKEPEVSPVTEQGAGNNQAQAEDKETESTETGSINQADKDLFVAMVSEASKLDSFTLNMDTKQKIDMGGEAMESSSLAVMDVTVKPEVTFKQTMTVEEAGVKQELESYMTADGFFMKDSASNAWTKFPASMTDQIMQGVDQQSLDPSAQLEQLIDYADKFAVEEKDGVYVFTLTAKGEAFSELIAKQLDEQMNEQLAMLGSIGINSIEYVIEVEKGSNKLLKMDVISDMSMEGSEAAPAMNIISDIKTTYSNHNAVEAIVVPQEALDAPELDMSALETAQ